MVSRVATTRFIIGTLGFCFILFSGLNTSADERDWGNLTNGNIYLFYCSHQDLGWENSYFQCKKKETRR